MDSSKNKSSATSKSDVKISQDVLVPSVVNEINAFFASDPDTLGDNPLSEAKMSQMRTLSEGVLWSTREITNDVYDIDAYLSELEEGSGPGEYTVLGLAGHGVASVFFTYYDVNEYLAVLTQLGYGDVVQEFDEETGELEFNPSIIGTFACKESFDEMIGQIVKKGNWPKGKILVIEESHKDNVERCGWLIRRKDGQSTIEWIASSVEEDDIPETAMALAYNELENLLTK